jgi:hypothetical protein
VGFYGGDGALGEHVFVALLEGDAVAGNENDRVLGHEGKILLAVRLSRLTAMDYTRGGGRGKGAAGSRE